jgi:hypothetical protein
MRQRTRLDERAGQPVKAGQKPARAEKEEGADRVRIALTFSRAQLAQVDQVAAQAGITRTALINLCVTVGLPVLIRTLSAAERPSPEDEPGG